MAVTKQDTITNPVFVKYLRRVASDLRESRHFETAIDYEEAADRIERTLFKCGKCGCVRCAFICEECDT